MRIFTTHSTIHGEYMITNNIQNPDPHMVSRYDIEGAPIKMFVDNPATVPAEVRKLVLDKFHQPEGGIPNEELLSCWQDSVSGRRALWGLMRVSVHYGKLFLQFVKTRRHGTKQPEGDKYLDTLMLSMADFGPEDKPVHFEFISNLIEPFGESHTHIHFGPHTTVITEVGDHHYRTIRFLMPSAHEAQTEDYPVEIVERTW